MMARFSKLEIQTPQQTGMTSSAQQRSGTTPAVWTSRADDARRRGQYETALQMYSRALEEDKSLIVCWAGQVQMLVQLKEYPEAELWSRKALELFPIDADLHAGRAQSLCRNGDKKNAFGAIDQAMQQPGQSAYRWMVRGELLLANRQSTDRHCFDKASQIDPDWLVPLETALIYRHYGQPGNALNRARLAVDRNPSAPYAWYVVAGLQNELGLQGQARRSIQTCLDLDPSARDAQDLEMNVESRSGIWNRIKSLWGK
jgi:tetratricopeptide (TPR) repeat protein